MYAAEYAFPGHIFPKEDADFMWKNAVSFNHNVGVHFTKGHSSITASGICISSLKFQCY